MKRVVVILGIVAVAGGLVFAGHCVAKATTGCVQEQGSIVESGS